MASRTLGPRRTRCLHGRVIRSVPTLHADRTSGFSSRTREAVAMADGQTKIPTCARLRSSGKQRQRTLSQAIQAARRRKFPAVGRLLTKGGYREFDSRESAHDYYGVRDHDVQLGVRAQAGKRPNLRQSNSRRPIPTQGRPRNYAPVAKAMTVDTAQPEPTDDTPELQRRRPSLPNFISLRHGGGAGLAGGPVVSAKASRITRFCWAKIPRAQCSGWSDSSDAVAQLGRRAPSQRSWRRGAPRSEDNAAQRR